MSERSRRWSRLGSEAGSQQLAVFTLGALRYGIDIMSIRQIARPRAIRPVPAAPAFVDGVIDLRGQVIPVMDLRRRFGLRPDGDTRASKLIIAEIGGRPLGLLVDSVLSVYRARLEEIQPAPQWITGPASAVFSGVCLQEGHLVLILDLAALLSLGETLRLQGLDGLSESRSLEGTTTPVPRRHNEGTVTPVPRGHVGGLVTPVPRGHVEGLVTPVPRGHVEGFQTPVPNGASGGAATPLPVSQGQLGDQECDD